MARPLNPWHGATGRKWAPREDRFWSQVLLPDELLMERASDCWIWQGHTTLNGYGRLNHDRVHRLAYEWLVGPIPEGLTLDHLCGQKLCVNPAHLEPCTIAENIRRAREGDDK